MFEALESRQLFSITVGTGPSVDTAPPPPVTVDAAESSKPHRPKSSDVHQPYMIIKMNDVIITGVT